MADGWYTWSAVERFEPETESTGSELTTGIKDGCRTKKFPVKEEKIFRINNKMKGVFSVLNKSPFPYKE